MQKKVLVIGNDIKLQMTLQGCLTLNGWSVTRCSDMARARTTLQNDTFTLILLHIHKQQENSFSFVKSLRINGYFTPVLYLGERSYQEVLKRDCSGLDTWALLPFNYFDFMQKVNKAMVNGESQHRPLLYSGISINEGLRVLKVKEKLINLGAVEMKILVMLTQTAGQVVALERLYSMMEQEGTKFSNRAFFHVSCLRKKLTDAGIESLKINFIKDGYRLDVVA